MIPKPSPSHLQVEGGGAVSTLPMMMFLNVSLRRQSQILMVFGFLFFTSYYTNYIGRELSFLLPPARVPPERVHGEEDGDGR